MVLVNAACGPASPLIHSDPLTGLQRDFHQLQRFNENMHVEMLTLRAQSALLASSRFMEPAGVLKEEDSAMDLEARLSAALVDAVSEVTTPSLVTMEARFEALLSQVSEAWGYVHERRSRGIMMTSWEHCSIRTQVTLSKRALRPAQTVGAPISAGLGGPT